MKILAAIKKCLILLIYSSKSTYYDDSNKLTIGKMEDETAGVVIEEFVRLKPKMYSFLVDHDSEFKKAKDMNRNVVEKIIYNGYKDVLLNSKCLRNSINRIQSKDLRIGTDEINKISLSCFDDNIYPKQWILWIRPWFSDLITEKERFFVCKSFFVKL